MSTLPQIENQHFNSALDEILTYEKKGCFQVESDRRYASYLDVAKMVAILASFLLPYYVPYFHQGVGFLAQGGVMLGGFLLFHIPSNWFKERAQKSETAYESQCHFYATREKSFVPFIAEGQMASVDPHLRSDVDYERERVAETNASRQLMITQSQTVEALDLATTSASPFSMKKGWADSIAGHDQGWQEHAQEASEMRSVVDAFRQHKDRLDEIDAWLSRNPSSPEKEQYQEERLQEAVEKQQAFDHWVKMKGMMKKQDPIQQTCFQEKPRSSASSIQEIVEEKSREMTERLKELDATLIVLSILFPDRKTWRKNLEAELYWTLDSGFKSIVKVYQADHYAPDFLSRMEALSERVAVWEGNVNEQFSYLLEHQRSNALLAEIKKIKPSFELTSEKLGRSNEKLRNLFSLEDKLNKAERKEEAYNLHLTALKNLNKELSGYLSSLKSDEQFKLRWEKCEKFFNRVLKAAKLFQLISSEHDSFINDLNQYHDQLLNAYEKSHNFEIIEPQLSAFEQMLKELDRKSASLYPAYYEIMREIFEKNSIKKCLVESAFQEKWGEIRGNDLPSVDDLIKKMGRSKNPGQVHEKYLVKILETASSLNILAQTVTAYPAFKAAYQKFDSRLEEFLFGSYWKKIRIQDQFKIQNLSRFAFLVQERARIREDHLPPDKYLLLMGSSAAKLADSLQKMEFYCSLIDSYEDNLRKEIEGYYPKQYLLMELVYNQVSALHRAYADCEIAAIDGLTDLQQPLKIDYSLISPRMKESFQAFEASLDTWKKAKDKESHSKMLVLLDQIKSRIGWDKRRALCETFAESSPQRVSQQILAGTSVYQERLDHLKKFSAELSSILRQANSYSISDRWLLLKKGGVSKEYYGFPSESLSATKLKSILSDITTIEEQIKGLNLAESQKTEKFSAQRVLKTVALMKEKIAHLKKKKSLFETDINASGLNQDLKQLKVFLALSLPRENRSIKSKRASSPLTVPTKIEQSLQKTLSQLPSGVYSSPIHRKIVPLHHELRMEDARFNTIVTIDLLFQSVSYLLLPISLYCFTATSFWASYGILAGGIVFNLFHQYLEAKKGKIHDGIVTLKLAEHMKMKASAHISSRHQLPSLSPELNMLNDLVVKSPLNVEGYEYTAARMLRDGKNVRAEMDKEIRSKTELFSNLQKVRQLAL